MLNAQFIPRAEVRKMENYQSFLSFLKADLQMQYAGVEGKHLILNAVTRLCETSAVYQRVVSLLALPL